MTTVFANSNVGRVVAAGERLDTACTMDNNPSKLNKCTGASVASPGYDACAKTLVTSSNTLGFVSSQS